MSNYKSINSKRKKKTLKNSVQHKLHELFKNKKKSIQFHRKIIKKKISMENTLNLLKLLPL
jgi:hypothetical protein